MLLSEIVRRVNAKSFGETSYDYDDIYPYFQEAIDSLNSTLDVHRRIENAPITYSEDAEYNFLQDIYINNYIVTFIVVAMDNASLSVTSRTQTYAAQLEQYKSQTITDLYKWMPVKSTGSSMVFDMTGYNQPDVKDTPQVKAWYDESIGGKLSCHGDVSPERGIKWDNPYGTVVVHPKFKDYKLKNGVNNIPYVFIPNDYFRQYYKNALVYVTVQGHNIEYDPKPSIGETLDVGDRDNIDALLYAAWVELKNGNPLYSSISGSYSDSGIRKSLLIINHKDGLYYYYPDDGAFKVATPIDISATPVVFNKREISISSVNARLTDLESNLETKASTAFVTDTYNTLNDKVNNKADASSVELEFNILNKNLQILSTDKADKTYVDEELAKKVDKTYVDTTVANLVNSAPEALDTLGELAAAIDNHEDSYDALLEVVGNKANKEEVNNALQIIHATLVNKVNRTEFDSFKNETNDGLLAKADITYVDEKIATAGGGSSNKNHINLADYNMNEFSTLEELYNLLSSLGLSTYDRYSFDINYDDGGNGSVFKFQNVYIEEREGNYYIEFVCYHDYQVYSFNGGDYAYAPTRTLISIIHGMILDSRLITSKEYGVLEDEVAEKATLVQLAQITNTIGNLETAVSSKAEAVSVYTKTEVDGKLNEKVNTSVYNSDLEEIREAIDGLSGVGGEETEIQLQNYYTKTEANALLNEKPNFEDIYTRSQTDTYLGKKANASDVYTKTESNSKFIQSQDSNKNINFSNSFFKVTLDGDDTVKSDSSFSINRDELRFRKKHSTYGFTQSVLNITRHGIHNESGAFSVYISDPIFEDDDQTIFNGDYEYQEVIVADRSEIRIGGTEYDNINPPIPVKINNIKELSDGTSRISITEIAKKTYVDEKVAAIVNSAPATLDTLNELSAALGNDPNFATTVATQIGAKANSKDLAKVATSGSYNDLSNKPTIPTKTSQLTNDSSFATTSQLFSKSYNDLTNKPTIPTIPSWVGSSKPVYTWSEITSKPTWIGSSKPTYSKSDVGLGNVLNVASYSKTESDSKYALLSSVKTYKAGTGISISSDGTISVNLPTAEGSQF